MIEWGPGAREKKLRDKKKDCHFRTRESRLSNRQVHMFTEEATRDRLNVLSLVLAVTASHALSSLAPYLTAMKHAITMATIAAIITIISIHLLSFNMSVYMFISRTIHICLLSRELCSMTNCVKQLTLKRNDFRCTIYEICERKGGFYG